MNSYDNFKDLLPDELKTIKELIEKIIVNSENARSTNLKYQDKNKKLKCPKCHNGYIVKNGFKNKTQRYKCKNCNKFFSISTNTLTSSIQLSYNQLLNFMLCLINYNTIAETAKIVGLSERDTYNIRIKIISTLNEYKQTKLQ